MKVKDRIRGIEDKLLELDIRIENIEGLEAKPEQVQSIVRQQDAALVTDESTGSAAGNPDGPHWTEGFEAFLKEQLELAEMAHRSNPCGPTSVRPRTLKMVMDAFLFHRGQGAA